MNKEKLIKWLNAQIKDLQWTPQNRLAFKNIRNEVQYGTFDDDNSLEQENELLKRECKELFDDRGQWRESAINFEQQNKAYEEQIKELKEESAEWKRKLAEKTYGKGWK